MPTEAIEDYLKTIYEIQSRPERVSTSALAECLGVAPASVTNMLKRLAELGLVSYEPYQGVSLTKTGRSCALEVIRRHRLVELYLVEKLGVPWDEVHAYAERWEHVLSAELAERMAAVLGQPGASPHGAPIPGRDGSINNWAQTRLTELESGQAAIIAQVSDRNPALLRYLGQLGLYPGVPVKLVAIAPFNGPLTIRIGDTEQVIGRQVAEQVFVTKRDLSVEIENKTYVGG